MSFLNPTLLFGVFAISIPIIVHLLNKRKYQRVAWAAMRFLRTSVEQNEKRIRLEDILLLILRCLLIALLALALARPAIKNAAGGVFGRGGVTALIIIDQSYSMGQTDGIASRFDKARQAALAVIDSLPLGSSVAVWMSSDKPNRLIPEPTFDLNLARATIRSTKLTDRRTAIMPALNQGLETLNRLVGVRKELYLITDGQSNGWRIDETRKLLSDYKRSVQTNLIFITSHEEQNLGVSSLQQVSGLAAIDHTLRFSVSITNFGSAEARDVHVTLKVDGGDTVDESSIAIIPPNDSKSVSLFTRLHGKGYHTITASIPADRIPADDSRTIAVRAVDKVRVLLVDGDPGYSDRDSEAFYLKNALAAAGEGDQALFRTTIISPSDLPLQNLDEYDALILAGVADFSLPTLDAFASYLERGGGLIVFPGERVQTAFYNEKLFTQFHFLPASIGLPVGDAAAKQKRLSLQDKAFDHPISAIWNDPASGSPSTANFFRLTPLTPDAIVGAAGAGPHNSAGDPRVVMKFSDGSPAIVERAWAQGRIIQFASTASTKWNDLPVHPGIFVPLLYRCLGAIVGRQDEALNVRAGDPFILHPGVDQLGKDALITRPHAEPGAPRDSRRIEIQQHLPTLTYDDTDLGGAYDVSTPDTPPMKFAVQPDPEESKLDDLSESEKRLLSDSASIFEWTPASSLTQSLSKRRIGTELWLPLLIIVIALTTLETLIAHWFSRPK